MIKEEEFVFGNILGNIHNPKVIDDQISRSLIQEIRAKPSANAYYDHKPKRFQKPKKEKHDISYEDYILKALAAQLKTVKKDSVKEKKMIQALYEKYSQKFKNKSMSAPQIKQILQQFYRDNPTQLKTKDILKELFNMMDEKFTIRGSKKKEDQVRKHRGKQANKEMQIICSILKYYFGEHQINEKPQYCNDYKTCEKWELEEIKKNIIDTNLGDFILKLPNPDNLDDGTKKQYNIKEQNQKYPQIDIIMALDCYRKTFDLESNKKLQAEREETAFLIAFYFLKFKKLLDEDSDISAFVRIYQFFKIIEKMDLTQYRLKHKEQAIVQIQMEVTKDIREFNEIKSLHTDSTQTFQEQIKWTEIKAIIYEQLNQTLLSLFKEQLEEDEKNQQSQIKKQKQSKKKGGSVSSTSGKSQKVITNKRFEILISSIMNLTEFIRTFPAFFHAIIQLFDNVKEHLKVIRRRQIFKGEYLKKTMIGQNSVWINTKMRPNDLTTLMRNCMMYRLTVKCNLFTRTFITQDEKHIMMVIKSNQEMLQNYAQKLGIELEVDLGATDLFSFEPVDDYYRPLRLHRYICSQDFKKKYNLTNKKAAQKQDSSESIESDLPNVYKKAQVMNDDQLRSSIIADQLQADEAYSWISNKFNVYFIKQKALVNEFNDSFPQKQVWQLYYVYNKLIIQFIQRVKNMYKMDKKNKGYYFELNSNIGMLLRLMFVKAVYLCNQAYLKYRENRTIFPKGLTDIFASSNKLKNIWYFLDTDDPSGFRTYSRTKNNERVWRKFQINELKDRSKFYPAQRLLLTNKIINDSINIGKSLDSHLIISYFPLHDPYFLKNIQIDPFLINIRKLNGNLESAGNNQDARRLVNKFYSQYECPLTKNDFTKMSLQKKLQFSCTNILKFDCSGIRYYSGGKIAFFFQFIKYIAVKAFPFVLFVFIIQILLWVQQGQILESGVSTLTQANNVIIFIFTFINVIWTTNLIERWKSEEKVIAYKSGVADLVDQDEKRVNFEGSFKRNLETDELNFEYQPKWKSVLKLLFTVILNLTFVGLVALVLLLIFLFKVYLFESGLNQSIVNIVPSIIIALTSKVFSFLYTILLKQIIIFQNHKTISAFEGSLVSKASLITFVITFLPIFVLAYFSSFLGSSFLCQIRTTVTNVNIQNCDYFVSTQLQSMIIVDFVLAIVNAVVPFVYFQVKQICFKDNSEKDNKFNYNFFQSIDDFFQEQDNMDSYMHNEELDKSWEAYLGLIIIFTATTLFAPAYPLSFAFLFITGILKLHTLKYEIIYYKKRIQPIKANSINWWLIIIEVISYVSIVTNVSYMIYTRKVFKQDQSRLFFFFLIALFGLKFYLVSQYEEGENKVAKRNEIKINNFFMGRKKDKYANAAEQINTDIQNVYYDQRVLKRKFHNLKEANVLPKKKAAEENKEKRKKKQQSQIGKQE